MALLRSSARGGSFQLKLFHSLSKFNLEDQVNSNDYLRVTSQTLYTAGTKAIKLLTFPHNPIREDRGMYGKVAESVRGRTVLFDWDPCKFLAITRDICSQVMSTKTGAPLPHSLRRNLYSLSDLQEVLVDSDSLAGLVREEVEASGEDFPLLARAIATKLLNDTEALASNANVFSFWLYLLLAQGQNPPFTLGFAGIPQPLLHTKLAQFTEKEQAVLSFIRWTKFLAERMRDGGQRSVEGLFQVKDMIKFQLFIDARYVRCNYTFELAKALLEQTRKDVCLVADPLARQAFLQIAKVKELYAQFPVSALDEERFERTQEDYLRGLENVVSPESLAALRTEGEQRRRMGMPLTEDQSDLFKPAFAEFARVESLEGRPAEEVDAMLFKMALWDVLMDTKVLESPHVPHKFFFISPNRAFLPADRLEELERKFYVCYRSLRKLKESLVESVSRWERPMTVEEALRGLATDTGLSFQETDYYAQEDDSLHTAMAERVARGG